MFIVIGFFKYCNHCFMLFEREGRETIIHHNWSPGDRMVHGECLGL